jgi:hypothetical protein
MEKEMVIYIETSIPSFYTERRTHPHIQSRRDWTREWWNMPKEGRFLVTSEIVIHELERMPDIVRQHEAIELTKPLELIRYDAAAAERPL